MPSGIQAFNASGDTIFDLDDRPAKFIGSFDTDGLEEGTFTDARLKNKAFMYYVQNLGDDSVYAGCVADCDQQTGVISFEYPLNRSSSITMPGPEYRQHRIFYGFY